MTILIRNVSAMSTPMVRRSKEEDNIHNLGYCEWWWWWFCEVGWWTGFGLDGRRWEYGSRNWLWLWSLLMCCCCTTGPGRMVRSGGGGGGNGSNGRECNVVSGFSWWYGGQWHHGLIRQWQHHHPGDDDDDDDDDVAWKSVAEVVTFFMLYNALVEYWHWRRRMEWKHGCWMMWVGGRVETTFEYNGGVGVWLWWFRWNMEEETRMYALLCCVYGTSCQRKHPVSLRFFFVLHQKVFFFPLLGQRGFWRVRVGCLNFLSPCIPVFRLRWNTWILWCWTTGTSYTVDLTD